MKLWIDDVRPAPEGYEWCRSVRDAIITIKLREARIENILRRYTPSEMAVAKFNIAVDDGYGEKKKTYFIPVTVFGKQAENCEKFVSKGNRIGVTGKIVTGSYEKDGRKVYTTDVVADRVEFLERAEKSQPKENDYPQGFAALDEDIPFA